MKRSPRATSDRLPQLVTIALFAVTLVSIPLALMMDERIDGDRSMYSDVQRMLALQGTYVVATGQPAIEARLSDGESVTIGDESFTVSDGVTLTVERTEANVFCVTARNESGAKTQRCND